jgi:hypothetical protein
MGIVFTRKAESRGINEKQREIGVVDSRDSIPTVLDVVGIRFIEMLIAPIIGSNTSCV